MIYMHRQMLVLELKLVYKETSKVLPSMKSFIRLRLVRVIRIFEEDILDVGQQKRRSQRHLKKSKYKRTPYTDPGPKKMIFRKGSIKEFDPLCVPNSM